jgi:hypothetical protein
MPGPGSSHNGRGELAKQGLVSGWGWGVPQGARLWIGLRESPPQRFHNPRQSSDSLVGEIADLRRKIQAISFKTQPDSEVER